MTVRTLIAHTNRGGNKRLRKKVEAKAEAKEAEAKVEAEAALAEA